MFMYLAVRVSINLQIRWCAIFVSSHDIFVAKVGHCPKPSFSERTTGVYAMR